MIICVSGVTLKDISYNSTIESKISYKTSEPIESRESLPLYFTTLDKWPKTTKLRCWFHTDVFNGIPKTIPVSWDFRDGNYRIRTIGCFCSWECAKGFLYHIKVDEIDQRKTKQIDHQLLVFANEHFDEKIEYIIPSKPYYKRLEFSGTTI